MRNQGAAGRPAFIPLWVLILISNLFIGSCSNLSADHAEGLFVEALQTIREEGLSIVPAESDAPAMVVRRRTSVWNPFRDLAEFERQVASVGLEETGIGNEVRLRIVLKPEAAKSMLEQRLAGELQAVRQESAAMIPKGTAASSEKAGEPGAEAMDERIGNLLDEAEKQLAEMLADADVESVVYMTVNRSNALPTILVMETRIERAARDMAGLAFGEDTGHASAGPDDSGGAERQTLPVIQETLTDTFVVT